MQRPSQSASQRQFGSFLNIEFILDFLVVQKTLNSSAGPDNPWPGNFDPSYMLKFKRVLLSQLKIPCTT